MKDFICVSCWTSFQVDDATLQQQSNVTCPKCNAVQPTSTTAVASSVIGADDTLVDDDVDSAAILGMLGDVPPRPSSDAPMGPPVRKTVSFMAATGATAGSGGGFAEVWPPAADSSDQATHGWALPPEAAGTEASSSAIGTLDRAGREPEADEPEPIDEELGWRIKLASGLVLSFPTIDMVTAWAKDKDADSVEISYGKEEFQPYGLFQDRYEIMGHPVEAFFGRGKATSPGMSAAKLPTAPAAPLIPDMVAPASAGFDDAGPVSDDFGPADDHDYVPDPAAVAAAAAADRQFKASNMYNQRLQFRTAPEPSGMPKSVMILLVLLLLGGGTVGVLIWQGIL